MSWRAEFETTDPDNVEMTLTITMTLGEWKMLRDGLKGDAAPTWGLRDVIMKMVERAACRLFKREGDT